MRTIFKNLVKDNFKAHSSIHFSQMHIAKHDESESYEDRLSSEEDITAMFAVNREYDEIIAAMEKLE